MLTALRSRDFRLLWLGQSASTLGDSLVLVAVGLFVTNLTGHPSDVGLVLAAYALPLVLFLLIGGVVADRLPRRKVMIVTDIARCTLHATLAVLILTGAVRIWQMVVIGALFGTAEAFFRPAYTGLVPQTVPETDIPSATALGGLTTEIATVTSPALATVLVLGVGGQAAFGLDAVTFAVSAILLLQVRPRSRGQAQEPSSVLLELRQGWQAVRDRAWVWATIAAFSVALLIAVGPFFVLGAAVAREQYGSVAVYGYASVAWGVGTLTGVLIAGRWRPRYPMRAGLLAAVLFPATIAVYAAAPPRLVTYAVMAVGGAGIGVLDIFWQTALAERIPPHLLSRVSAWDWMGSMALLPLGYLLAGPVGAAIGNAALLIAGGAAATVVMVLALIPRSSWRLERLPTQAPAGSEPARAAAVT